jgi:hydroxyacylglutathione hydrolase
LSNLPFALAVEPENDALIERAFAAQAQRERGEPTVPFTIADEIATNPFFRTAQPAIRERCEAHAGHTLATPLEVFTKLREWKNSFRG